MLIVICDLVFAVEAEKKAKAAAEEAEKQRQQNQAAQQAQVNQVSNYCWKTWTQQTLSVNIPWRPTTRFVIKALSTIFPTHDIFSKELPQTMVWASLFTICLTLDTEQRIALNSGMSEFIHNFFWPLSEQRIALNGSMGDFIHNIFLTRNWAKNCLER